MEMISFSWYGNSFSKVGIFLWKEIKDIQFVKYGIGHVKVESTSGDVQELPENERHQRILSIKKGKDFIIRKTYDDENVEWKTTWREKKR